MKSFFKFVKIVFFFFLTLFLLGAGLFYTYRTEIKEQAVTEINKRLNAKISLKSHELSFLSQFPKISFNLNEPIVFDAIKGSQDTFIVARQIDLTFNLRSLLKNNLSVSELSIYDARIKVKTDKNGTSNFNIIKTTDDSTQNNSFDFSLEKILLQNVEISYINQQIEQNHLLKAKEVEALLELTDQQIKIFLDGGMQLDHIGIKKLNYLKNKNVALNLGLNYYFENNKLEIVPSDIQVENAKFKLQGTYLSQNPDFIDFSFKSEEGDIQTLISILPQDYTQEFSKYQSKGKVAFKGSINGKVSKTEDPKMQFEFAVKNASIYHPETNRSLEKVNLSGSYQGQGEVSKLVIGSLDAFVGKDHLTGAIRLDNLKNPYLNMDLKGSLDVPSLVEFLPSTGLKNPNGTATVDLHFQGPLNAIGNGGKFKAEGKIKLTSFSVDLGENKPSVKDFNAIVSFNNYDLNLESVSGKIGTSDIQLKGKFIDFLPYLFGDKKELNIQASFASTHLDIDELLKSSKEEAQDAPTEEIHYFFSISEDLKLNLDLKVDELKFRNLVGDNIGKNLSGTIVIQDQYIVYESIKFDLAGGKVSTSGNVNAKNPSKITVKNWGNLDNIDVGRAIYIFEDFNQDFLTHDNLQGNLNARIISELSFDSTLVLDMSHLKTDIDMKVVNGALKDFGPMTSMRYYMKTNNMLKYLRDDNLKMIEFDTLKNTIKIANEKVIIPKMKIHSSAHDFTIIGTHTFDNHLDYSISFPIVNYKRKERLENEGVYFDEHTGKFDIYLKIVGPADSYEVVHEKQKTKEAVFQTVEESVNRIFQEDEKDPYAGLILDDDSTNVIEIE